jgi:AcrR family transcriptional regulator
MDQPMAKRRQADAARLERADWERAALAAIASGGLDAVAVEPLARTLGVTKGSFYWHFANREALLTAALARWEAEYTESVIALLRAVADPRRRLTRLIIEASLSEGAARFHTWLAAAVDHPVVRPVMSRVTARRIGYLVDCFAALGLPPAQARRRALLAYAAYVGLMHLSREAPAELPHGPARAAYVRHVVASLLPPG